MAYVNLAKGLGAARGRNRVLTDLYPRRSWRRGIAGFGRSRGLGLSFPQVMVSVPQPAGLPATEMPTAETEVANAAAQLANDPTVTAQDYPTLAAITANLVAYAQTLCFNSWAPYTCVGFDPVATGQKYAALAWAALSSNPNFNPSPGAVAPPAAPAVSPGAPFNPASVPGSSALPPPPASSPTIAPQPVSQPAAGSPGVGPLPPMLLYSSYSPAPGSASIVSGDGSGAAAAPAFNWPLIGGAAVLVLGGLYFLGGSK